MDSMAMLKIYKSNCVPWSKKHSLPSKSLRTCRPASLRVFGTRQQVGNVVQ